MLWKLGFRNGLKKLVESDKKRKPGKIEGSQSLFWVKRAAVELWLEGRARSPKMKEAELIKEVNEKFSREVLKQSMIDRLTKAYKAQYWKYINAGLEGKGQKGHCIHQQKEIKN